MGCCPGCGRIILSVLNLILFVIFLALGIIGLLLKFSRQVIDDLLHKAVSQWSSEEVEKFATTIVDYGSSISTFLTIIGFLVAFTALLGIISLCYKARCIAGIYIIILIVLCGVESGFILYAFAIPDNTYHIAEIVMNNTLANIGHNDSLSAASLELFNELGSDGKEFCCGMKGVSDFDHLNEKEDIPTSCCLKNYTNVIDGTEKYNCTYGEALLISAVEKVPGCDFKVHDWVDNHKAVMIGIPCGLVAYQLLLVFITIGFCMKRRQGRH